MLTKFSVKNFRGFKDEIVWDLTNHQDYDFNESAICNGVIKNGIIYGPNGAGKSNFTQAVFDIVGHLGYSGIKNNSLNLSDANINSAFEPIEFKYTFKFGDNIIDYWYSKVFTGQIIEEYLMVNKVPVIQRNPNMIAFVGYKIQSNTINDLKNSKNNISIINYIYNVLPLKEGDPVLSLKQFVEKMLWLNSSVTGFIGIADSFSAENEIIESGKIDDFSNFLYNISGQKFSLEASTNSDGKKYLTINKINSNGMNVGVSFNTFCSTGTKVLEKLYAWMLMSEKFSFIIIDEFDAFYHFELAYKVCQYLFEKNCQIFLTTHNTFLMTNDLLRPDCNFLINNNVIKPLCDCTEKDLTFASNIEKLYRANSFRI